MKYSFAVTSMVTAEANYKKGTSRMIETNVHLMADPKIENQWKDKDGVVTKEGMKVQSQGLIQGLIANIHFAHQMGYWDSAEHLRYIIKNLEKGFNQTNTKASVSKM